MAAPFYKWLLFPLYMALYGFLPAHPFYISVTEIKHNEKEKLLEISCKMFLDDTEKALKKQYNTAVDLTHPKDPKKAQEMVYAYIKAHLKIKADGRPLAYTFVGFEVEGASIWSYYQASDIPAVHKLDIDDSILYEMYDTQIGIIHAEVGSNKKSTRLNYPETSTSIEF